MSAESTGALQCGRAACMQDLSVTCISVRARPHAPHQHAFKSMHGFITRELGGGGGGWFTADVRNPGNGSENGQAFPAPPHPPPISHPYTLLTQVISMHMHPTHRGAAQEERVRAGRGVGQVSAKEG